jgi:hypothetical protein
VLLEGEVVGDELPARLPFVTDLGVADDGAFLAAAGRSAGDRVAERAGQVDVQAGAGVPPKTGCSRLPTRSPASQLVPCPPR